MKKSAFLILALLVFSSYVATAQVQNPVKWSFKTEFKGNQTYNLVFTATIEDKWHIYGMNISGEGPIPTSFTFEKCDSFSFDGKVVELTKPEVKFDESFGIKIETYSTKAVFQQKIKVTQPKAFQIKGTLEYMSCDNARCLPPKEIPFTFSIPATSIAKAGSAIEPDKSVQTALVAPMEDEPDTSSKASSTTTEVKQEPVKAETPAPVNKETGAEKSLLGFILLAIAAGIGGVFTPCVYPMIPMTVSFFMRGEEKRTGGILNGLVFGLSIIAIYTLLGAIVTITKSGETITNYISTNWLPNSIFFLMFILFALWFFGMFEIVLPGTLANKFDAKADKGGITGAFFMALTLIIVSFSCTGPFIGGLLVEAARGTEAMKPIIGMFFYGLAFALPFVIFAISPVLLKKMSKSGSWLNTVKVVVAFILLAFSLKFLSTIDTTRHLNILPREIFLSLWIVIFGLLGFYLLGKIKLPNDGDLKNIPVPRFILAIITFSFVVYMIPGLFGANLKLISAFLPPETNQQALILGSESVKSVATNELCGTPKYSDFLELPYGLQGYFEYNEGLACAKAKNKPVFLDIKGHACANCKKMEGQVWSDPRVLEKLRNDFIIVALYCDDKYKLPENEWVKTSDGSVLKTIGDVNLNLEIQKFNINTQPYYAVLDHNGNPLATSETNLNIDEYLKFLEDGKNKFYKD